MNDELTAAERAIIEEEEALLLDVQSRLARHVSGARLGSNFDQELLALRDQIAESRAEDHAMLVEHMTRLAALRRAQDRDVQFPADPANPFFAHLRLRDMHEGEPRIRDVLIGRRAFISSGSSTQIVDWRNSPISRIYYCYQEGDEYEEVFAGELQTGFVEVRRTVTIHDGVVHRVRVGEDILSLTTAGWTRLSADSSRLAGGMGTAIRPPTELGGKSNQRLPEITALIDPDQFKIIASPRSGVVIIRGGAGTGKTTIALHRIAYLHFQDRRRFAPKRILVITPGDALRRYVSHVLPSLDVRGVKIRTFQGWAHETVKRLVPSIRKRKLTDETPPGARRLKRHPALLALLEDAVRDEGRGFEADLEAAGGKPLLRAWVQRRNLPTYRRIEGVRRWMEERGAKAIPEAKHRAVRKALELAIDTLLDPAETWADALTDRARVIKALGDAPYYEWELEQLIETVTMQADDPMDLSDLDPDRRTGVDGRALNEGELQGRLDSDDLAIILRICQLKFGRLASPNGQSVRFEHVVVDEAQDHSPLVLQVLCETVQPGGPVTLAGDTAQRIYMDNGFSTWEGLISTLRLKAHILPPLAVSYRSTRQVMALARHVLGPLAPIESPRDARDGAPVQLMRFDEQGEAVAFLADALKSLRDRERRSSVALVARTPTVAESYYVGLNRAEVPDLRRVRRQDFDFSPGIDVTDIFQIKGLEYDYIILLETTGADYPPIDEARHLFHVGATRAAHQLWLITSRPPSPLLPIEMIEGDGSYPVEPEFT